MELKYSLLATVLGSTLALVPAVAQDHHNDHNGRDHGDHHAQSVADQATLVAVLSATEGNEVYGWVRFEGQDDGTVQVSWNVQGLDPDSTHAFHVHEFGDLSSDGTAAGGHFNPEGHEHGLPDQELRHVGDLGNLEANDEGVASGERTIDNLQLTMGKTAIVGRGLIVHASEDDGGQPTGNAGARITQGVIGIAQVKSTD